MVVQYFLYIASYFQLSNLMNNFAFLFSEVFIKTLDYWKSLSNAEKSKWTSEYEKEKEKYSAL